MKRIYSKPLDEYEEELEAFLNKGEYVSVPKTEFKRTKKIFEEAAENYFRLKKAGKVKLSA